MVTLKDFDKSILPIKRKRIVKPFTKRTNEEYIRALTMAKGHESTAAKLLNVTYYAVHQKVKRHKNLQRLVENLRGEFREDLLDSAETVVADKVKSKQSLKASKFTLERWGRERGWGKETTSEGDRLPRSPLIINIQIADNSLSKKRKAIELNPEPKLIKEVEHR